VIVAAPSLDELVTRVFAAAGAPPDVAAEAADALVDSNLAGHDSHGVMRVPEYVEAIQAGEIRPAARPVVASDRGAVALVSGEWGFGQVAGRVAADEAVERARAHGVAAVGLVRVTHLGRMGAYPERAAAAGCVLLVWVGGLGGPLGAVPHGGARRAFGANPFAAGFPVEGGEPVVVDFATTSIAIGKVMVARAQGRPVPPGSLVDRDGRPSTDPDDLFDGGAMLPFGGHKGYCVAMLAELLGQVLTGSDDIGEAHGGEVFERSGALFVGVHAGAFRPGERVAHAARTIVDRVRAVPPAPDVDRVQVPGEPEARTRAERAERGIELPTPTWDALLAVAGSLGVAVSETAV